MNKKAQFFLIAALIIAGAIIGLGTVYNTSQIEESDAEVLEFTDELSAELQQIQDAGTFTGNDTVEVEMEKLITFYQKQSPDSDLIILYGNEDGLVQLGEDTTGEDLTVTENAIIGLEEEFPSDDPNALDDSTGTRGISTLTNEELEKYEELENAEEEIHKTRKKVRVKLKFKESRKKIIEESDDVSSDSLDPLDPSSNLDDTQTEVEEVVETTINKDFDLKPGDNFYIVVRKKVKNEEVVAYK